jgi:hypothetical protein
MRILGPKYIAHEGGGNSLKINAQGQLQHLHTTTSKIARLRARASWRLGVCHNRKTWQSFRDLDLDLFSKVKLDAMALPKLVLP